MISPVPLSASHFQQRIYRERLRTLRGNGRTRSYLLCIKNSSEPLNSELLERRDTIGKWRGDIGVIVRRSSCEEVRELIANIEEQHDLNISTLSFPTQIDQQQPTGEYPLLRVSDIISPLPKWKRYVDVLVAVSALTIFSPCWLGIALLIKLGSRGPIFFRQDRYGIEGKTFSIYKFRTMQADANAAQHVEYLKDLRQQDGKLEKIDQQFRLVPLGKWLRALSIDEVPQLINVIKGEMSIVGPRPDVLPPTEYESWQLARFDTAPGLTGLWQTRGKNSTTFDRMVRLDIGYIRHRCLGLDLRLMLSTFPTVIGQGWAVIRPTAATE